MIFPLITIAYGDGLASETLAPSIVQSREISFSIGSTPFFSNYTITGTQINLAALDITNQKPLEHVTIAMSIFKNDKAIFGHVFKSDTGNFTLNFYYYPNKNNTVTEGKSDFYSGENGGVYDTVGPIFNTAGLYRFKINLLTMDSYSNDVNQQFDAGISIPENDKVAVFDTNYGKQQIRVISYYDQLHNIKYDPSTKSLNFTMPFDWSEKNIDQVKVVHQEILVPRSFGDYLVTKYVAYINNMKLQDQYVLLDDYSSTDNRIIHIILYKEKIKQFYPLDNTPQMVFSIKPSDDNHFSIVQPTKDGQYKISLIWNPTNILAGSVTRFNFTILDPNLFEPVKPIPFAASIIEGNDTIYQKNGISNPMSGNTFDIDFPTNYTGLIIIKFTNLNGSSLASAEFPTTVSKQYSVPEFPLNVSIVTLLSLMLFIVFLTRRNHVLI